MFPKGLGHCFGQKYTKKSIWWRSLRKQAFLDNRNIDLGKPQNWHLVKVFSR